MTTPTVTELTRPLEPIGHDTFADEAERGALLDGHPQRPAVAGARWHGAAPVVPRDRRPIRRQHTLVSPRRAQLGSR